MVPLLVGMVGHVFDYDLGLEAYGLGVDLGVEISDLGHVTAKQ